MVDYVPVEVNLDNLIDAILVLNNNDNLARAIAIRFLQ